MVNHIAENPEILFLLLDGYKHQSNSGKLFSNQLHLVGIVIQFLSSSAIVSKNDCFTNSLFTKFSDDDIKMTK